MIILNGLLKGLITVYRYSLSPLLGKNCRYLPTCSEYAMQAIDRFGAFRGGLLAVRRIGRCHPLGGHGYDPVPDKSPRKELGKELEKSPRKELEKDLKKEVPDKDNLGYDQRDKTAHNCPD